MKGEGRDQEVLRRDCISDDSISSRKEEADGGSHLGV